MGDGSDYLCHGMVVVDAGALASQSIARPSQSTRRGCRGWPTGTSLPNQDATHSLLNPVDRSKMPMGRRRSARTRRDHSTRCARACSPHGGTGCHACPNC
jgi:hypothetical protein